MSVDVRAVAIRFADLWAVDPHQMVEEIYADDIEMENMANPARVIRGSAELHAVEDRLAALIPEHRHELIRVIVDGSVACLETTVVSPTTHEYAPACVWWWLDGSGKVAAEAGWFDWNDRSTDSARSHGTVPPSRHAGSPRDQSWYVAMAAKYARGWSSDADGAALPMFATPCTFGHVGREEFSGVDDLARWRRAEFVELPGDGRRMDVQSVVGEGSAMAMLVTIGDATHVARGTVVVTFDADDLIVSERTYCDWTRAVPRDAAPARHPVGSPGWTLRAR